MNITVMKILLGLAAVGYLSAGVAFACKRTKLPWILNAIGWLLNTTVVAVNWIHNGYVPFVSMYQVLTFLGMCFTFCLLYVWKVQKETYSAPFFCLCAGVVMIGTVCMDATLIWHFVPALQSGWFVPHVFCYMLSYTLCTVASVLSVVWYVHRPKREEIANGIYQLVMLAFPFMTMGLLFGAMWANDVWTEFWSWDAKENWALITWLLYALYLHCRRHKSLQKFQYICTILGFIALFMAFQGVNLFGGSGIHAYT